MTAKSALSTAEMTRFPALDGLRGLAIIAVMFHHYGYLVFTEAFGWQRNLAVLCNNSYLGVDLFFVLSGFLISGILIDSRRAENYFKRFYWRRSLRIFPVYFFYLFIVFVVVRKALSIPFPSIDPSWYMSYLQNWRMADDITNPYLAHLWSLAVEEQFYLVWPFVILAVEGKRFIWFCIFVLTGSIALRAVLIAVQISPLYIYMLTVTRADALTAGALIAVAIRSQRLRNRVDSMKWTTAIICACGWFLAYNSQYSKILGYSASAGFFAMIVFWAADSCPSLLTLRPLRILGKYSYGIYIYHVILRAPVYDYFHERFPSPFYKPMFFTALVSLTFVMAYVSWHSLEAPFLRLKGRYFSSDAPA